MLFFNKSIILYGICNGSRKHAFWSCQPSRKDLIHVSSQGPMAAVWTNATLLLSLGRDFVAMSIADWSESRCMAFDVFVMDMG